jgi:hypothetical protein
MMAPPRLGMSEKILTWIAVAALVGGIAYTITATVTGP